MHRLTFILLLMIFARTPFASGLMPAPASPVSAQSSTGWLRVLYADDGHYWLWQEETSTATELPLPVDAFNVGFSPDYTEITFVREPGTLTSELWVADLTGTNARLLVSVPHNDTRARYPDAIDTALAYRWIARTRTIVYSVAPIFDALGSVPLEASYAVNVDSGATHLLFAGGEVIAHTDSPDGRQLAALTENELRLINLADGQVQAVLPLPLSALPDQSLAYSPDGQYLVVFTLDGITIVNPADGSKRDIPFAYAVIGLGEYSVPPGITWRNDNTSFYTLITTHHDFGQLFAPDATFTLWQIDVVAATATQIGEYNGFILSAMLAPDQQRLAYWIQDERNNRKLYLAELAGGEPVLYTEMNILEFVAWNPDSTRFIYWQGLERRLLLGGVGVAPVELGSPQPVERLGWIDNERLLTVHPQDKSWELWLRPLNSEAVQIATLKADFPFYLYFVATN